MAAKVESDVARVATIRDSRIANFSYYQGSSGAKIAPVFEVQKSQATVAPNLKWLVKSPLRSYFFENCFSMDCKPDNFAGVGRRDRPGVGV